MKFISKFASTILVALLLISTAQAAEIRMGSYGYDYGKAASGANDRDVFVICESCPAREQLALKPKTAILAIRMADKQFVKTTSAVPEKRSASDSYNEHASATETVRPACADHNCLQPVYFRFDQSDLSDYEKDQLDSLIKYMKAASAKGSQQKIRITGHTCDMGNVAHNDRLSLMRAKAVATYLAEHGFDINDVSGEGMSRPLSKIRSLNRRVEIKIIY